MVFDTGSDTDTRALERLTTDMIGWLTTVRADGQPQTFPIWFLWDNGTILMYSQPNTPKLRHIAAHPQVSLNLDSQDVAAKVVILTGEASIDQSAPPADQPNGQRRENVERGDPGAAQVQSHHGRQRIRIFA